MGTARLAFREKGIIFFAPKKRRRQPGPARLAFKRSSSGKWVIWEIQVQKNVKELCHFGGEWGRHGSPRADTLGKRSHGLQEGF